MNESNKALPFHRLSERSMAIGESTTLAIAAESKRMKASGIDVISFSTGEPDFPTPERIKQAAVEAIGRNFTRYTQAEGIPELRKAIADKFTRDNNIPTDPNQTLVSAGGKQSLANGLLAILDSGDEVLIGAPYWTSYPDLVLLAGGTPVILPTTPEDRYKIKPDQIRHAISPRTRAIIINSPSNPSGVMYTRREMEELAGVIAEAGIYVLSDELYEKIVYDGHEHVSIGSLPGLADLAITINGVSKAFAMTGWRIGYMRGPEDVIAAAARIQSQMTSHPSSISQIAALTALTEIGDEVDAMVAAFARRRELIVRLISEIPDITFPVPDGAFYLFLDVSAYFGETISNDIELARYLLQEHHIATVPGAAFGYPDAIRLSYSCSEEDLVNGAGRIREGLRKLREVQV